MGAHHRILDLSCYFLCLSIYFYFCTISIFIFIFQLDYFTTYSRFSSIFILILNLNIDTSYQYRQQKIQKYGPRANANGLDLYAAVFSTTGEMDVIIKNLLLEQIRLKLQLVDGEVKKSKVQKIMKHCVSHISAAINRSASRNIFLNATKMVNLARHTQQNFSSSTSCDLTSSSASSSPDDLIQQLELQIMNQNVFQT